MRIIHNRKIKTVTKVNVYYYAIKFISKIKSLCQLNIDDII